MAAKWLVLQVSGLLLPCGRGTLQPPAPGPSALHHSPHRGPLARQGCRCPPFCHPLVHRSIWQPCGSAALPCSQATSFLKLVVYSRVTDVSPSGLGWLVSAHPIPGPPTQPLLMELGWRGGLQAHCMTWLRRKHPAPFWMEEHTRSQPLTIAFVPAPNAIPEGWVSHRATTCVATHPLACTFLHAFGDFLGEKNKP